MEGSRRRGLFCGSRIWGFPSRHDDVLFHNGETALTFHVEMVIMLVLCAASASSFLEWVCLVSTLRTEWIIFPPAGLWLSTGRITYICGLTSRRIGKDGVVGDKKLLWVVRGDKKMAYVVHSSWCTSTSCRIRAMCITDACTHVSAFNGLQRHMKTVHMKGEYTL